MPALKPASSRPVPEHARTREHSFTLELSSPRPFDGEIADALFESGCEDATVGEREGLMFATFDRAAPSIAQAVLSAIENVESAGVGIKVLRVQPEELVNATAIAERVGRTRESIRTLAAGLRGPGGFPSPAEVVGAQRFWRWPDVASWFAAYTKVEQPDMESAIVIAMINAHLGIRLNSERLTDPRQRELLAEVLARDLLLLGKGLTTRARSRNARAATLSRSRGAESTATKLR